MTGLWLASPWSGSLGLTLLHFVWQGTLIAGVVYLTLLFVRSSQARYRLTSLALLAMAVAPLGTVAVLSGKPVATPSSLSSSVPTATAMPGIGPVNKETASMVERSAAVVQQPTSFRSRVAVRDFSWGTLLPYLVIFWLSGVGLLSVRLLGGWWLSRRWRRVQVFAPLELQHRLLKLSKRLELERSVRLLVSTRVAAPVVLGWVKPVILLPASALTGLSLAQLELVLAHELAHVKRHDYLVNLVQNLLETLLFYHPAVWWVSGIVRQEREFCCDDLVTSLGGDRRVYAEALTRLERQRTPSLALGAGDGALLHRVKRLLGVETSAAPTAGWALLVTVLATGLITLATLMQTPARAQADVAPTPTVQDQVQSVGVRQLWVDVKGEVTFTEGYADIGSIGAGGYLEVEERRDNRTVRFIRVTSEADGLSYRYAENLHGVSTPNQSTLELVRGDATYTVPGDTLYLGSWSSFAERTPEGAAWFHEALLGTVGLLRERDANGAPALHSTAAFGYLNGVSGFFSRQAGTYSILQASVSQKLFPLSSRYDLATTVDLPSHVDIDVLRAVHLKAHRYVSDASVRLFVRDLLTEHADMLTPTALQHLLYLVAEVEDDTLKAELLKELAPSINDSHREVLTRRPAELETATLNTDGRLRTAFFDAAKTLQDVALRQLVLGLMGNEVVIDAGHGGVFRGAVGYADEATVMLAIAKKVEAHLEAEGVRVVLTRKTDAALADTVQGDIKARLARITPQTRAFISLHASAANSPQARGIRTWVSSDNSPEVEEATRMLAQDLQNELAKTGAVDGGLGTMDFALTKNATVPTVLGCVDILTRSDDRKGYENSKIRKKAVAQNQEVYREASECLCWQ